MMHVGGLIAVDGDRTSRSKIQLKQAQAKITEVTKEHEKTETALDTTKAQLKQLKNPERVLESSSNKKKLLILLEKATKLQQGPKDY